VVGGLVFLVANRLELESAVRDVEVTTEAFAESVQHLAGAALVDACKPLGSAPTTMAAMPVRSSLLPSPSSTRVGTVTEASRSNELASLIRLSQTKVGRDRLRSRPRDRSSPARNDFLGNTDAGQIELRRALGLSRSKEVAELRGKEALRRAVLVQLDWRFQQCHPGYR
jgi:hypothetical protein